MADKRRIVVTSALPYANGDIHIGHLVEYLQTDFWVRYQKMKGNECVYVCADDTHGTPVMIRARKEGIAPEELIERSRNQHMKDFADFQIEFDNYYTTNSPENKALSERIFKAAEANGFISKKVTPQLYCNHCKMFLPDRFVKGSCPKCGAEGQYGDSCDKCGATYAAEELGSPVCTTCGEKPVLRDSEHLYFELEPQHGFLRDWIPGHTAGDVANKLLEWFAEPLRAWCISRDAPYFGFEIPGHPGKFFYVWVDAPIGYIASLENAGKIGMWNDPDVEICHFIGKDIIRFHCLLWPAMLKSAGLRTPDNIFVHGFLTVNGEKMSKSKGTFVNARTYLDHLPPEALRYYYACKLSGTSDDLDLNLDDFVKRVNSDLVGKLTNLASRSAQMLNKNLGGRLGTVDDAGKELAASARAAAKQIEDYYESRRFSMVTVAVARLADSANEYFDRCEPWKLVKTDPESARTVLTNILNVFRILAIYLKPVLPVYAEKAAKLFGESGYSWSDIEKDIGGMTIAPYEYLATRIDSKQVEAMVAAAAVNPASSGEVQHESRASKNKAGNAAKSVPPLMPEISFDQFEPLDLRVATVISCTAVEKSQKLVKFILDAGPLGQKTVFSGIRESYPDPAVLNGKQVLFVANLAPRKMSVGVSEGMVLLAGDVKNGGSVVTPLSEVAPGAQAR